MLPGYALMAQGTQIHVAAWPGEESTAPDAPPHPAAARQLLLSRAFAAQGACYVVSVGAVRSAEHVPERFRGLHLYDEPGESCIIGPMGNVLAGPARGETVLVARGSLEAVLEAKVACDVGGHYARPDVLRFSVDRVPEAWPVEKPDGRVTTRTEPEHEERPVRRPRNGATNAATGGSPDAFDGAGGR